MNIRPCLGILFATTGSLANAVNLLPNGDFSNSSQVTSWAAVPGYGTSISWSSDDAIGDTTSGSLQVDIPFGVTAKANSACFAIQSAASYTYGGQSRIVAGAPTDTFVCYSYDTTNCTGSATGLTGPIISQGLTWPAVVSAGGTLSNSAKTVQCKLDISNGPPFAPMTVRFDNLFFDSTLPTPVSLQSFSVE